MTARVGFGSVAAADQSHEPACTQSKCTDRQRGVSQSHSPQRPSSFSGSASLHATYGYVYGSTSTTDPRSSPTSSPRLPRLDSSALLNVVPEDRIIMEFPSTEHARTSLYTGGAPIYGDDEADSEQEEWELDEELEEHGLYRGSYRRLMLLYTLTPLTFLVFFAALAALPSLVYPITEPWPYPSAPYLPHPIPELLASAALFSLAYLLRGPLTTLIASLFPSSPSPSPSSSSAALATALHSVLSLLLQQSALPLLLIAQHAPPQPKTHDPAFRRVWWLALGWAAAEAVVTVAQGYAARALYRDVLVSVRRSHTDTDMDVEASAERAGHNKPETQPMGPINGSSSGSASASGSRSPQGPRMGAGQEQGQRLSTVEIFERETFSEEVVDEFAGERQPLLLNTKRNAQNGSAIKMQVEDELDALLVMRAREELEEAYGVPIIHIPVFLSCLQRINALLLTLGIYLLLAQSYLRSTLAPPISPPAPSPSFSLNPDSPSRSNLPLALAVPFCLLVQCVLALLQTPPLLPRVGAPAAVYSASLVSLGVFFGGLAVWEGLS